MTDAADATEVGIASVCLAIPAKGISHAGGEYVRRHHAALGIPTTMFAEPTAQNFAAIRAADPEWVDGIVPPKPQGALRLFWGFLGRLVAPIPILPSPYFLWALLRDRRFRRAIDEASVLEIQWTQFYVFAKLLARGADIRRIGVTHDVVSQALRRKFQAKGGIRRVGLRRLLVRLTEIGEAYLTNAFDNVLVFSEKDESLLREIGVRVPISVVPPGLESSGMPTDVTSRKPLPGRVLTVANFSRDENVEGVLWFLDEIWPAIIEQVPTARFFVVGADPQRRLVERVARERNVTLTGYIEDLDDYYRDAELFVVPVLRGAGVKFKTVTAMLWGVPTLSTTCGAEGVGPAEHFIAVTDDPEEFSSSAIRALNDGVTATAESLSHARQTFGRSAFEKRIRAIYGVQVTSDDQDDR